MNKCFHRGGGAGEIVCTEGRRTKHLKIPIACDLFNLLKNFVYSIAAA